MTLLHRSFFLCSVLLFALAAPAWATDSHGERDDRDDRGGGQARAPISSANCYGTVTSNCTAGEWTYGVSMSPGYKLVSLTVQGSNGQLVLGPGFLASPAGWKGSKQSSKSLKWEPIGPPAGGSRNGFRGRFDSCQAPQVFILEILAVPGSKRPQGAGPGPFSAYAGCATPVQAHSWGEIRRLYR